MSQTKIQFFVPGAPKPAGSKRAVPIYTGGKGKKVFTGKTVVMDAGGQAGQDWRMDIKHTAAAVFSDEPLKTSIGLKLRFCFYRPKSHYGSGRNKDILKDSAPIHHTIRPDLLKLARGVEDALTGIIWRDDSQIYAEELIKCYVGKNQLQGVYIEIS